MVKLKDLKQYDVATAVQALSKKRCSIGQLCKHIRSLGGDDKSVPALHASFGPPHKRIPSLVHIRDVLQWLRGWQARKSKSHAKTHVVVPLPRSKVSFRWGCRICSKVWSTFPNMRVSFEEGLDNGCEGRAARHEHLRGKTFKQIWCKSPPADHDVLKRGLQLTKKDLAVINSGSTLVRKEIGRPKNYRPCFQKRENLKKNITRSKEILGKKHQQQEAPQPAHTALVPEADCHNFVWQCPQCQATLHSECKKNLSKKRWHHIQKQHRDGAAASKTKKTFFKCKEGVSWPCTLCGERIRAETVLLLGSKRHHHIRTEHRGVPPQQFLTLHGRQGREISVEVEIHGSKDKQKQLIDKKRGELLADGDIESNPGPSLQPELSLKCLNADGLAHTYEFLNHVLISRPHIIGIQEIRANHVEAEKLRAFGQQHGYRVWTVTNPPNDANQTHGGLAIFVRCDCRGHLLESFTGQGGEFITIDFEVCHLTMVWQRPADVLDGGLHEQLALQIQGAQLQHKPWFGFGDYNELSEENPLVQAGGQLYAVQLTDGSLAPTRWQGTRAIDYLVAFGFSEPCSTAFLPWRISDHKPIHICLPLDCAHVPLWQIERPCDLSKPSEVSNEQWSELLLEGWSKVACPPDVGNPDQEWHQFCKSAEQVVLRVLESLNHGRNSKWARGCAPCFKPEGSFIKSSPKEGTFRQRNVAKWLGRLREAHFQRQRGWPQLSLEQKVRRTWPKEISDTLDFEDAISAGEALLAEIRLQRRREQLNFWRSRMSKLGKETSAWLKETVCPLPNSLTSYGPNGEIHTTASMEESLNALVNFWTPYWHSESEPEELQRLRSGNLSRLPGPSLAPFFPTGTELHTIAQQKVGGAAGMDGWQTDSIAQWPNEAWNIVAALWRRWAEAGAFPTSWQDYKNVFIPKKAPTAGSLAVADMRPISIQSAVCRCISSYFVSHDLVKEWFQGQTTTDFHGALSGRSVASAIVDLAEGWQNSNAVLISLDMHKAFDTCLPELATGLLRFHAVPEEWVRYYEHMWCKQTRWLFLGRWGCKTPQEVCSSLPQGDPCAPIAFSLLLTEASRLLRRSVEGELRQSVFIDDRNVIVFGTSQVRQTLDHWQRWCDRLGLQENTSKLKIVARSPQLEEELLQLGLPPAALGQQTRVLGVDFKQEGAGPGQTMLERRAASMRILQRIKLLPVDVASKETLVRTRVTAKVAWGIWLEPFVDSFKFTTQVKMVILGHRNGSRPLWELLAGHWVCPTTWGLLQSFGYLARGLLFWQTCGHPKRGGQWFDQISGELNKLGFTETNNGFAHPQVGRIRWPYTENLGNFKQWLHAAQHCIRESWRVKQFNNFLSSKRRDAEALRHVITYDSKVTEIARKVYQAATVEQRAVMVGAAWSIQQYYRVNTRGTLDACPCCGKHLVPSWYHLCWECEHFNSQRVVPPWESSLALRLGWPLPGHTFQDGMRLVHFMGAVRASARAQCGFY